MRIDYLLHQTSIENLREILIRGFKFTLKSQGIVESTGDLERFIWFDFIGQTRDRIVYSDTGYFTAANKGITIVFDFEKVLEKVRSKEWLSLKFLSDNARYETNTSEITLWDSTKNDEDDIPDRVARSVECVISTNEVDKTLNRYFYSKSDRDEIRVKLIDCVSKIIVCRGLEKHLESVLKTMGFKTHVVVHRGLSKEEMRRMIDSECHLHSREECEMMYAEGFIASCMQ